MTRLTKWFVPLLLLVVLVGVLRSLRNDGKSAATPPATRIVRMGGRPAAQRPPVRTAARNGSRTHGSAGRAAAAMTSAPKAGALVVTGGVTGPDDALLEGVSVWLTDADAGTTDGSTDAAAETRTGHTGLFRLEAQEPPRQPVVNAWKTGFASTAIPLPPAQADSAAGQKRMVTVNLRLVPCAQVRGRVTDSRGRALAGVTVCASAEARAAGDGSEAAAILVWPALTAADGTFGMEDLPAGMLAIEAARSGFTTRTVAVRAPAEHVQIALDWHGAEVEGCVYHLAGGSGAARATVRLTQVSSLGVATVRPQEWTTMCDDLGVFRFSGLPDGAYNLSATKDGLRLAPRDPVAGNRIHVSANEPLSGLQLFLYEGHTLSGAVTEENTTAPIEGVLVTALCKPPVQTVTGADGSYRLSGVAAESAGTYVAVQLARTGYVMSGQRGDDVVHNLIRLDPHQTAVTRNFEMQRIVHIEGRVVDGARLGVAAAQVAIGSLCVESAADGLFHLECPGIGNFVTIRVRAAGHAFMEHQCRGLDGQSTSGIEIVLSPEATVHGVVFDPQGQVVSDAVIEVLSNGSPEPIVSDTNGQFFIGGLPAGKFDLWARKDGFARSEKITLHLNKGARHDAELHLRRRRHLGGIVVDGDGKPVPEVRVTAWNEARTEWFASAFTDRDGRFRMEGIGVARALLNIQIPETAFEPVNKLLFETNRDDLRVVLTRRPAAGSGKP